MIRPWGRASDTGPIDGLNVLDKMASLAVAYVESRLVSGLAPPWQQLQAPWKTGCRD
jgi:hypothetical protein